MSSNNNRRRFQGTRPTSLGEMISGHIQGLREQYDGPPATPMPVPAEIARPAPTLPFDVNFARQQAQRARAAEAAKAVPKQRASANLEALRNLPLFAQMKLLELSQGQPQPAPVDPKDRARNAALGLTTGDYQRAMEAAETDAERSAISNSFLNQLILLSGEDPMKLLSSDY